MSTFVTVGNGREPFDRLLRAVVEAKDLLPQPVFVQCGSTRFSYPAWNVRDFVDMHEFEHLVRESSLLVMHAGAGSVINAIRAGKRPVVMPRRALHGEVVDDHQVDFAEALASEKYVFLAREPAELIAAIDRARTHEACTRSADDPPLVRQVAQLLEMIGKRGKDQREAKQ